jgi:hypothetical protein
MYILNYNQFFYKIEAKVEILYTFYFYPNAHFPL